MGAMLGIQPVDCTQNGTIDWNKGSLTTELAKFPIFTLVFVYSSIAAIVILFFFFEAALFTATRVPRSSVANHRINTVIMLSIYPSFIIWSFPAVLIPSAAQFCMLLADLYYSFVMFKFVVLQVDYYGGHRKMMARLAASKVMFNINSPVLCCLCCFKPVRLTKNSFFVIKFLVLQIAILKPILTFFQAIASFAGLNLVGTGGLVLQVVTVLSTLTAATGINMITKATSSTDLEKYDLKGKAAMMTAALMMIGLQSAIINVVTVFRPLGCTVPFPSSVISSQWQAFLLILESTLMMIPMLRYYRTADGNVVGVPPPIEDEEEEATSGLGKMRQWVRRHTLM
ncbi:organic solute transporter subunit alpha-like [Asterias rubens]|uniref:organic solute transporter subunit alpha-like n=1 Tax=Asterias rubens TaxID=7604 RepID=UPI0014553EAB|nr:organic solute transporter subunit alpha-like [Asterias rubens]